ncbi:MAG: ABC transporter permease [Actinomycetota bacterium]|nr:ABC transporter permease [Actinomycetota bacterium]
MIHSIRAELVKLTRRRFVLITLLVTIVYAIGGTAIGVITAEPGAAGPPGPDSLLSISALADAGGGTAVFAQMAAFGAAFLLAVFIGTVAGEFSRGTFRTMLLQQPGRVRVLVGKMVAVVGFAAVLAIFAEVIAWITARLLAPGQGIDTSAWTTTDAVLAAADDYGRLLVFIVGWSLLATMIGVLARSVPLGVGVGLVWAGPIENIVGESWSPGERFFPGLLLRAIINPDSSTVSSGRVLLTLSIYGAIAIAVAGVALSRRDVTS